MKRRVILLGLLGASLVGTAAAQTKVKKSQVRYQTAPRGEERCGLCMHYVPSASGNGVGTCKIVAGSISAAGWCAEWEARPKAPAKSKGEKIGPGPCSAWSSTPTSGWIGSSSTTRA